MRERNATMYRSIAVEDSGVTLRQELLPIANLAIRIDRIDRITQDSQDFHPKRVRSTLLSILQQAC
jgi:hypothetical protein